MSKAKSNVIGSLKWIGGPILLLAALGWMVGFGQASASAGTSQDQAALAGAGHLASSLGPAADRDLSPAAQASGLREVQRINAERNKAGEADKKAFRDDGWELVKTDAPDAKLVALDPALLEGREDELRVQIASTVASPAQAGKLADIAVRAQQPETRTAAVEGLGRIGGEAAQRELFKLLTGSSLDAADPARRAVAPLLRPSDLSDPFASELAAQLDSDKLTAVERKQLAFTLSLVGLRDGTQLPEAALQSLSPAARELLKSMTALAGQSNPLAPHAP